MSKITDEIIVILSHVDWNFPCDYVKQTGLRLAKKAKVVVFNPIHLRTIRQLIFERKANVTECLFYKEGNIDFFPSFGLVPFQRFALIRKINLALNFFLFRLYYSFKFGYQKPIFWVFNHTIVEILPLLRPRKLLVYDRVDHAASVDHESDAKIKNQDLSFLKAADFVLTNSSYALKYIKKYNSNSFLAHWSCDVSLFSSHKRIIPKEIGKIKKPRLGLVGHIDHRLDFRLLYDLAVKRSDWNFILVGPVFDFDPQQGGIMDLYQWLSKLKKLPNVYFLGKKQKDEIPDFINSFDVCLILYDTSQEFVKGCNPMKLYEYLAMGKPVVSAPIEAVEAYQPTVKIAKNATDFEETIEKILKNKDNQQEIRRRQKIALASSWENRVKFIWQKIFKHYV